MIERLLEIKSREDLVSLSEVDLEELMFELATRSGIHDDFKLKDYDTPGEYFFVVHSFKNKQLVLRIFTEIAVKKAHLHSGVLKVIKGGIGLNIKKFKIKDSLYPWLDKIEYIRNEEHHVGKDEICDKLDFKEKNFQALLTTTEKQTAFLQVIDINSLNNKIVQNNFSFLNRKLSDEARKLIKLTRNHYIKVDERKNASLELAKVLEKIGAHETCLGYFVENYHSAIKGMTADYKEYMLKNFGDKYFKEMIGNHE